MTPEIDAIRAWQKEFHRLARDKGWYDCRTCNGSQYTSSGVPGWPNSCGECAGTGKISPLDERRITEALLLIHAEISEAVEHRRKNNHGFGIGEVFMEGYRDKSGGWHESIDKKTGVPKPDGFAIELADVFIRLLDLAEYCGIDLAGAVAIKHLFNQRRAYRHGNLAS